MSILTHPRPASALLGAVLLVTALGGCGPDEAPGTGTPGSDPAPETHAAAADTATAASDTGMAATDTGTPIPSLGPARESLTPEGWGPLRIGMTRQQVVEAAGEDANPDAVGGPEPEACDEWRPIRTPDGMLVMIEEDRLTRITYFGDGGITTPAGLSIGAEREAVVAAHGNDAQVEPHRYLDGDAAYITVWTSGPDTDRPRGIQYEVGRDGRVTHIHVGGPSIRYVEGCL